MSEVASTLSLYDYNRFPLVRRKENGEERVYRQAYGRLLPGNPNDVQIELWAAATREQDGEFLGEFQHYKNAMQLCFPHLQTEWHHWLDMMLESMTGKSSTNTWLGGGGIGKSWFCGVFPRLWYAASPMKRGVMIINTTQKSQMDRAWGYVTKTDLDFPFLAGEQVGNKAEPRIGLLKKNSRGKFEVIPQIGVMAQTVKKGSSAQATADLKGLHPEELMIIVEESNHLIKAHLERARGNWVRNRWYKIHFLGNPEIEDTSDTQGADALYHFSTPKKGWSYIRWGDDRSWENVFGGRTYHFDIYDSPAIAEPERFVKSYWLPNEEGIRQIADEMGGEDSALFKQQARGIYDHESLPFNPITLGMVERFAGKESALFTGFGRQRWAAFDPAYSGNDEAFLKIAESGLTENHRVELDFLGSKTNFSFKIDSKSAVEPSFQMLEWVRKICHEWEVPPENLIMDANIIGIGLGDIFATHWSKKINKAKAGNAKPSKEFVDAAEQFTAADLYVNAATEYWMGFQKLLISQQIRGLDDSVVDQLVMMPAEKVGDKVKVLEKINFRKKFGFSPDRAEAVIYLAWMVKQRGLKRIAEGETEFDGRAGVNTGLGMNPWIGEQYKVEGNGLFVNAAGTPFGDEPEEQGVTWQDFENYSWGGME